MTGSPLDKTPAINHRITPVNDTFHNARRRLLLGIVVRKVKKHRAVLLPNIFKAAFEDKFSGLLLGQARIKRSGVQLHG